VPSRWVADLVEVADGLRVVIRHSRPNRRAGAEIAIPRGNRLRPAGAVQTGWRQPRSAAAGVPASCPWRQGGHRGAVALCRLAGDQAADRRHRPGPAAYSGHSLRSGFLTSAAEAGTSLFKLTEVRRHKSLDTLRGYVRRVDLFKEHAGAAFL
jgi:hypothetical protein